MDIILKTILTGIGGTLSLDLWVFILRQFKIKSLDYRFVGRWLGHMLKGKFFHENIMTTPSIKNEALIGWIVHYSIGISFACLLVVLFGKNWLDAPTLYPAILIGIATVTAPFFIMQPAFGFGIASSKLPNSNLLRVRSVLTHSVYGIGLYVTAFLLKKIW